MSLEYKSCATKKRHIRNRQTREALSTPKGDLNVTPHACSYDVAALHARQRRVRGNIEQGHVV